MPCEGGRGQQELELAGAVAVTVAVTGAGAVTGAVTGAGAEAGVGAGDFLLRQH